MVEFVFEERTFVVPFDGPEDEPDIPDFWAVHIGERRHLYPELAHWDDFAFGVAWGAWSGDILGIDWHDDLACQRDTSFLAYCYVSQRWPTFNFGGSCLFDSDTYDLGEQQPWRQSPLPPKPVWVKA